MSSSFASSAPRYPRHVSSGRRLSSTRRTNLVAGSILVVLSFFGLFPYIFMVFASFKDNVQFYRSYWTFAFPLHFENYASAWEKVSPYLVNSLFVAIVSSLGVIIFSSLASFVFARYRFPLRNLLYGLIVMLLMVPGIATLIPLFILVHDLGWLNTYWVLIVPYIVGGSVFGVFLMRTFVEQIPDELFEAAQIDGAAGWQIYLRILLPLSGPIIGTITLLTLIGVWNDYFWPLLTITNNSLRTVTVGLSFFQGQFVTLWGPLFAGYTLASLPLLLVFTFASRYLIAGIQGVSAAEGVK